jgi:hypothetical protein
MGSPVVIFCNPDFDSPHPDVANSYEVLTMQYSLVVVSVTHFAAAPGFVSVFSSAQSSTHLDQMSLYPPK